MIFSRVVVGILVAALGVAAQSAEKPFALASPGKLEQCKNSTIVWQGGKAPFKISIKPMCGAGQNTSEEQHAVSTPGATSFELPINFPADTVVIVSITDSSNMQAAAPPTTIVSGDADGSCIVQTACSENIQAPNVPVALAPSSSGTAIPTDRLITADPSAGSASTDVPTTTASMVVLYTYIGPSSTNSIPSSPASSSKSNAARLGTSTSKAAIFGAVALVGSHLALGL